MAKRTHFCLFIFIYFIFVIYTPTFLETLGSKSICKLTPDSPDAFSSGVPHGDWRESGPMGSLLGCPLSIPVLPCSFKRMLCCVCLKRSQGAPVAVGLFLWHNLLSEFYFPSEACSQALRLLLVHFQVWPQQCSSVLWSRWVQGLNCYPGYDPYSISFSTDFFKSVVLVLSLSPLICRLICIVYTWCFAFHTQLLFEWILYNTGLLIC